LSKGLTAGKELGISFSISCTRLESNYSSCTGRSSENICSSSGGAHEKEKRGDQNRMKLSLPQNMVHFIIIV